jgi:transposase
VMRVSTKFIIPDRCDFTVDLSPAFISGIKNTFPQAEITFDRFHVVKLLNGAMNKVRQQERLEHDELKDILKH